MKQTWLFTMCKEDGSTPLGQCPTVEVEASDRYDAYGEFYEQNPGYEVVSFGLKSEIEEMKKRHGIS